MFLSTQRYGSTKFHHSCSEHPNTEKFERHCHSGYELIYVVKGAGKYVVESAEYPLYPNTVLFLRPYEYHYVCPDADCTYERYVIHFSGEVLYDAVQRLSMMRPSEQLHNGVYFPADAIHHHIRSQFTTLSLDCFFQSVQNEEEQALYETVLQSAINQILILLSYHQSGDVPSARNAWVGSVIRYLNENIDTHLSLEDIARHFFVSKYHLSHTFLEHTGISVMSYLNTKRVALAEQLLEDGISASVVAERVGFRDYSVFYRAYRKITGESPAKTKRKSK